MVSNWLTPEELKELTGYTRRKRIKLALAEMNIRFITRPLDGFPLVSREILHVSGSRTVLTQVSKRRDPSAEVSQ